MRGFTFSVAQAMFPVACRAGLNPWRDIQVEAMLEYQMLVRRKSDVAKINAAFKARRVYGHVYGVRPYDGEEKGFSEKPFNHQVSLLTEYEQWDSLYNFMEQHFPGGVNGKDTFIIGEPTTHNLPNPYDRPF